MQINYLDEKLRKLCLNKKEAEKKLGTGCAKKLRTRWSDIEAAANVKELTAGNPHPLEPDSLREFSVELADGKRLVFRPDHEPTPLNNNNTTDWAKVTAITIVYIGDYHKSKQKRK